MNEKEPRESKIGLTMRQTGLGKLEWLVAAREKEAKQDDRSGVQGVSQDS
jgi:DNA-directed RNA polymerase subunit E'